MKAHELDTAPKKNRTRAGRGISAGRGKTAGRGTKGQNARSGGKRRSGFEGGQNPIFQRLPKKRGFTSFKQATATVTTEQLDILGATVNNETLFEAGLIEDPHTSVKVIVKGEVSKKHTVQLQGASKSAIAAIEKAGGTFVAVERKQRTAKKSAE